MIVIDKIKKFGLKIIDKIVDHIARAIALAIICFFLAICIFFWEWAKTKHSLELYGVVWIILLTIFLFLLSYFSYIWFQNRDKLKNPNDIVNTIEDWVKSGYQMFPFENNTTYYFSQIEHELHIKKRKSRLYLPMIALRNGYTFEPGIKTFRLTKLTPKNNPMLKLEQYLNEKYPNKETNLVFNINDIAKRFGWPNDAVKYWLCNTGKENDKYEINLIDRNTIGIKLKE